MPRLKVVEAHLNQLGYSNTWKLQRNTQLPERPELDQDQLQNILQNTKFPICQNIDVIVPQKPRTQSQELKLRRFLNVIGDPCEKQPGAARQEVSPVRHDSFVRDDDRRAYEIEHFISTEENYVQKLRALVNSIALPLRAQAHSRNPILNSFKHATIFINCDQLLEVNEVFLAELKQLNNSTSDDCFGDVCARNMNAFDCYRKYLSGKRGSEELQKKEYAENQAFRSFIVRAKEDPRAKALEGTLSALLMEPVQRISRYTLQLGVIIKYTPKTHPDWIGLTKAHAKFDEIAKMVEDDLTKLANMLHNLYTSIKDSPCSLINQSRSLVTHLDATEIHRETLKPIRPVTLFLFTDKLMVASRHSHQTKSMEVCGMNDDKSSTSGSFIPKKLERIRPNQMLRFKGWADVEQVELFEGIQDRPDSFLLRVSSAQEQQPQDQQCSDSTAYFQKCARLFAAIPPKESRTSLEASYVETCQEFIASFQKTQALSRRYEPTDETFSRSWQGLDVYSSFYTPNSYKTAKYRNNIAIAYVEEGSDIEIESLISQVNTPWIIGLVQSDTKGYRLSLSSKINLAERDLDRAASGSDNGNKENNEFVSVFWYNVIMCERKLRHASGFTMVHDKTTEEELEKRSRSRSRSRSLSRSTSGVTLSKIFGSRSRSTSPSRSQVSLSSSLSSPLVHNVAPPKKRNSFGPIIRPRAKSLSVDSAPLIKPRPQSQIIQKTNGSTSDVSLSDLQPYDLVKRQESASPNKKDTKVILDLSLKRRSMPENYWANSHSVQKKPLENSSDFPQTHSPLSYSTNEKAKSPGDADIQDLNSRPSSRSSTTSTVSSNQHTNNSYAHSSYNTLSSLTSQSTRSSLSLEDLEITKDIRTPSYFTNSSTLFSDPVDNDDYASQVHEKYLARKRTNSNDRITRKFLHERPALATIIAPQVISSQDAVHQLTKEMNASLCQLIERCNAMELQARRVTDQIRVPSTEGDVLQDICKELRGDTYAMYHHLNTKLGNILAMLETNAQQPTNTPRPTIASATSTDDDSKESLDRALSERDYWHRRANELNQQLVESRK